MKKHLKVRSDRTKRGAIAPKQNEFRTAIDAAGIRRPIQGAIGPDGEAVYPSGSHPRPAPTSSTKCGGCRHGEASDRGVVCRSFLSPRAGFAHDRKHACGYGRAGELVGA